MLIEKISTLGLMGWPLIIVSCLSLALILERLIAYALLPSLNKKSMHALLSEVRECSRCNNSQNRLCKNLVNGKGIRKGVAVLLSHNDSSKVVREEIAGLWLLEQKRGLQAWLKPLMLIGILAPMLGLLGTVLGLIDMFQGIAMLNGPVTPDVLADGLFTAMFTTAFGLMVAIPSLAAAHGFGIWANHYVTRLEFALNHVNLILEGVDMNEEGVSSKQQLRVCPEVTVA